MLNYQNESHCSLKEKNILTRLKSTQILTKGYDFCIIKNLGLESHANQWVDFLIFWQIYKNRRVATILVARDESAAEQTIE